MNTEAPELQLPPLSGADQERLARVMDEFLIQLEEGKEPDLESICEQHSDLAVHVRHYARSVIQLQQVVRKPDVPLQLDARVTSDAYNSKVLGDYKLIREIGRGGMGVVYEAHQISLDRKVAVKILPFAAVLDARQIARFQNEAQAAAQLHHPNIVPVYAIGNDRGTHFYSMQLIDGRSLDQAITQLRYEGLFAHAPDDRSYACDHQALTETASLDPSMCSNANDSPEARMANESTFANSTLHTIRSRSHIRRIVEFGIQAARALGFAHEHGIIHRDIKPSNLLVDSQGKLWVTDFGLAQCASRESITQSGDVLGTLRYMSPEQAAGKTHWVDNRVDIYALGATLYELLTLQPAIRGSDRVRMIRQILDESPTAIRTLNPAVPVDLENVIHKSISRLREDRYATAEEFADDLDRFLSGKATLARRPTWLDQASRWVSRHSRFVTAMAGCLVAISFTAMVVGAWVAHKNREISRANLRAIKHLEVANEVVDRFGTDLIQQISVLPGSEKIQADVTQNTIDYLKAFSNYASHDSTQSGKAARAFLKLADLQAKRGEILAAIENYTLAQEQLDKSTSQVQNQSTLQSICANNMACCWMKLGKVDEAIDAIELRLKQLERVPKTDSHEPNLDWQRALLGLNLSQLLREKGDTSRSKLFLDQSAELLESVLASHKNVLADSEKDFRETKQLLLTALIQTASHSGISESESRLALSAALRIAQQLTDSPSSDWFSKHQVAVCYVAIGSRGMKSGSWQPAESAFRNATSVLEPLVKKHPANPTLSNDFATALNNLGQAQLALLQIENAAKSFQDARRILEQLNVSSDDYNVTSGLAGILNNQAIVAEKLKEYATAQELLEEAIALQKTACEMAPQSRRCKSFLIEHERNLARIQSALKLTHDSRATDGI